MAQPLFYVDYSDLSSITDKTTPIGVVVNMREFGGRKFLDFINELKVEEETRTHNIASIIIKTDFMQEMVDTLVVSEGLYYTFYNEADFRKEIKALPMAIQKQLIGNKVCRTGVDILLYRMSGIRNLRVASPLTNNLQQLEMLKNVGWNFFCTPNQNVGYGDMLDPNWIRPEGIKLYEDIISHFVLASGRGMDANTIFNAYNNQAFVGQLKEILVNFDTSDNPYREQWNMLPETFDYMKATVGDDYQELERLKRSMETYRQFTIDDSKKI